MLTCPSGKVLLIAIVFCFTFITMVGGNPQHDAYGFRYWNTPVRLSPLPGTPLESSDILIGHRVLLQNMLQQVLWGSSRASLLRW
jgi:amino acid permease